MEKHQTRDTNVERRVNNARPDRLPTSRDEEERDDDMYIRPEELSESRVKNDPVLDEVFTADGRNSTDDLGYRGRRDLDLLEKAADGVISQGTLEDSKGRPEK